MNTVVSGSVRSLIPPYLLRRFEASAAVIRRADQPPLLMPTRPPLHPPRITRIHWGKNTLGPRRRTLALEEPCCIEANCAYICVGPGSRVCPVRG